MEVTTILRLWARSPAVRHIASAPDRARLMFLRDEIAWTEGDLLLAPSGSEALEKLSDHYERLQAAETQIGLRVWGMVGHMESMSLAEACLWGMGALVGASALGGYLIARLA